MESEQVYLEVFLYSFTYGEEEEFPERREEILQIVNMKVQDSDDLKN